MLNHKKNTLFLANFTRCLKFEQIQLFSHIWLSELRSFSSLAAMLEFLKKTVDIDVLEISNNI